MMTSLFSHMIICINSYMPIIPRQPRYRLQGNRRVMLLSRSILEFWTGRHRRRIRRTRVRV